MTSKIKKFFKKNDPFAEEKPKGTHFWPRQKELNLREAWSSWNGYRLANYFYDAEYEYFCIRNTCGTYDICGMQKYEITGKDAEAMLNRMITRNLVGMADNRVTYAVWCTDDGRLIDDGTIFKLGPEKFVLVCGSPCLGWLEKSCYGFDDVQYVDLSEEIAALAFQGPLTCEVLKKMGLEGIENLKPFNITHFPFHGGEIMVSRTGFTGDLGYELWTEPKLALKMWDELYKAGEDYGIQPFGEEALNMARLEAGFLMPEMEFHEALKTVNYHHDQSPLELSLGWMVDFKKPHFNGRRALLEEKKKGSPYKLVKLDIPGNKPAVEAGLYKEEDCSTKIGYVTSAMWSPVVKANIAMAMIETKYLDGPIWAEIYYYKELRPYRKMAKCKIQKKPFWTPARAKATPPPPF